MPFSVLLHAFLKGGIDCLTAIASSRMQAVRPKSGIELVPDSTALHPGYTL
jgi:hypothetical protein